MCTSNIVGMWPFDPSKKFLGIDRYTEIVYGGLGRHVEDVPPENLTVLLKVSLHIFALVMYQLTINTNDSVL